MTEPNQVVRVDSISAARAVDRPEATIRAWAHRGLITPLGKDGGGRNLYDLAEIFQVAQRLAKYKKPAAQKGNPE
jgi:DNA-binding transcriptional MerR regulator